MSLDVLAAVERGGSLCYRTMNFIWLLYCGSMCCGRSQWFGWA